MTSGGGNRRVLVVAILASFVAFLDGSVVNLALPAIARDLHGGLALQQWIVDSYLLTLGALILVAGSISDVFGRIPVLRWGLVAFGAGSVLAAVAPSGLVLVGARLIQGLGAAFLVPSSLALINSTFGEDEQPRAIGVWTAWTGTAFVLGPLLGGLAVDLLNWRWIFILSALPVVATFVLSVGVATTDEPRADGCADRHPGRGARRDRVGRHGVRVDRNAAARPVTPGSRDRRCRPDWPAWRCSCGGNSAPSTRCCRCTCSTSATSAVGNLATVFVYAGVSIGTLIVSLFLQEIVGFSATEAGICDTAAADPVVPARRPRGRVGREIRSAAVHGRWAADRRRRIRVDATAARPFRFLGATAAGAGAVRLRADDHSDTADVGDPGRRQTRGRAASARRSTTQCPASLG